MAQKKKAPPKASQEALGDLFGSLEPSAPAEPDTKPVAQVAAARRHDHALVSLPPAPCVPNLEDVFEGTEIILEVIDECNVSITEAKDPKTEKFKRPTGPGKWAFAGLILEPGGVVYAEGKASGAVKDTSAFEIGAWGVLSALRWLDEQALPEGPRRCLVHCASPRTVGILRVTLVDRMKTEATHAFPIHEQLWGPLWALMKKHHVRIVWEKPRLTTPVLCR